MHNDILSYIVKSEVLPSWAYPFVLIVLALIIGVILKVMKTWSDKKANEIVEKHGNRIGRWLIVLFAICVIVVTIALVSERYFNRRSSFNDHVENNKEVVHELKDTKETSIMSNSNTTATTSSSVLKRKKEIKLFIETIPESASVKILNLRLKFYQGIGLEPGKYTIIVSANGYITKEYEIDVASDIQEKREKVALIVDSKKLTDLEWKLIALEPKIDNAPSDFYVTLRDDGKYFVRYDRLTDYDYEGDDGGNWSFIDGNELRLEWQGAIHKGESKIIHFPNFDPTKKEVDGNWILNNYAHKVRLVR